MFAACAVIGSVDRPVVGGIYREAVVGQPLSLNPLLDPLDPITRDVSRLIFAGLVRVVDGGEIQGDLAERWTTEDDGRIYVFHLRPNALWHDGHPVIAADVQSTIGILQSAEYWGPMELRALWRRVQVDALDSRTIRLRLDEPYASFIEACSFSIVPSHLFRPEDAGRLREHASSYQAIGAGPFKIVEQTAERLRLARHSGYQGGRPYLDEVDLVFFPDVRSAVMALVGQRVDGFAGAPSGAFPTAVEGSGIASMSVPLFGQQMVLFLNHRNSLIADRRVRQAIAAGIDRARLLADVAGSSAIPVFGPIPSYSWSYLRTVETPLDRLGARAVLDAAGWVGSSVRSQGGRSLRLQLVVPPNERLVGLSEGIKSQLELLGIQVDLQPTDELDLYRERLSPRRFDMALLNVGLGTVDPDPSNFWDSSQAEGGFNFASYQRAEADALLRAARADGDPTRRRATLEAFQQLWIDDVPSVVLASPTMTYAIADRIRGVRLGVVPQPDARFQHVAEWYIHTERVPALLG